MTDEELELERAAIDKTLDEVLSSDVCDYVKQEFVEHANSVNAEIAYRRDGEFMMPLSLFGIVDF